MNDLISIVIPTCNRPELLLYAVRSALGQTYRPVEVVVSDDSQNDESERALKRHGLFDQIRYTRNSPPLKQALNVNQLFGQARGARLLLLHDDDWLMPTAVHELHHSWCVSPHSSVAYGLQYLADADGQIDAELSAKLNKEYFRTDAFWGVQSEPKFSALMGQIPNNGFLVRTDLAQKIQYKDSVEVSHSCDFDFGLRLAQEPGDWILSPQYVSVVRLSRESILRSETMGASPGSRDFNFLDVTWNLIEQYPLPDKLEKWRSIRLAVYSAGAVKKWLKTGNRVKAAKVMFLPKYAFFKGLERKKLVLLLMLFLPDSVNSLIDRAVRNFESRRLKYKLHSVNL